MSTSRTQISLVRDALRFFNEAEIFIGIGRTTPWTDEATPPVPDITATGIEELVAYKKITSKSMVIPTTETSGNIISWRGGNYKIVDPTEAIAEGAHWVYIRVDLVEEELDAVTFRQIGTVSGLVRAEGVSSTKNLLLPSEVEDHGFLELIENRKAIPHQLDTTQVIEYVREF